MCFLARTTVVSKAMRKVDSDTRKEVGIVLIFYTCGLDTHHRPKISDSGCWRLITTTMSRLPLQTMMITLTTMYVKRFLCFILIVGQEEAKTKKRKVRAKSGASLSR